MHVHARMYTNIYTQEHTQTQTYKDTRIHLLTDMYRYLNLHNCANASKKYMRAHHTHMYTCSFSQMHNYTYTYRFVQALTYSLTQSSIRSFTHSLTHSLTHSFTHSLTHLLAHIFSLSLTLTLFRFDTSRLIQAHSFMLMHVLTATHNYMCTRTDSIMRSYNLILSYIHSHTRA